MNGLPVLYTLVHLWPRGQSRRSRVEGTHPLCPPFQYSGHHQGASASTARQRWAWIHKQEGAKQKAGRLRMRALLLSPTWECLARLTSRALRRQGHTTVRRRGAPQSEGGAQSELGAHFETRAKHNFTGLVAIQSYPWQEEVRTCAPLPDAHLELSGREHLDKLCTPENTRRRPLADPRCTVQEEYATTTSKSTVCTSGTGTSHGDSYMFVSHSVLLTCVLLPRKSVRFSPVFILAGNTGWSANLGPMACRSRAATSKPCTCREKGEKKKKKKKKGTSGMHA